MLIAAEFAAMLALYVVLFGWSWPTLGCVLGLSWLALFLLDRRTAFQHTRSTDPWPHTDLRIEMVAAHPRGQHLGQRLMEELNSQLDARGPDWRGE